MFCGIWINLVFYNVYGQSSKNILFHTRRFAKLVGGFIDFAAVVWCLAAALWLYSIGYTLQNSLAHIFLCVFMIVVRG